ncbi:MULTISPECIES: MFS transporter [unclassified Crossiella]|uniref:MFS transporter n=1 Tax=unclassified Crossiella TaxID=2620835 RepID=UPI001FFFEB9D|nr:MULTISPECIES: MFS transporter [unclassified Crossiella]MCK2236524.1 MHS family MFS transporter [Crossiella sp. S99.2]MCK2250191.1 MHS family MFS transporter [Crossiella sp. S99.1]
MAETAQRDRPSFARLAVACGVGSSLEFYDFLIYGTASALVFGRLFFPQSEPWTATLLAFSTFAVGFLMRPIGSIIFGHFGDRLGRRRMLVISLSLMGVSTALMGLLPTYAAIGIAAPLLLLSLRIVHGLSVGGETAGATLLAVEHAPEGKRGLYGSLVTIGSPLGAFLANGAFALVLLLPEADLYDWGWRLPFLAGIAVVLVGLFARRNVAETPEFERLAKTERTERAPLIVVLREHKRLVLLTAGVNLGFNAFMFIVVTFLLSYGSQAVGISRSVLLYGSMAGSIAQVAGIVYFCRLTDRIGRKPVLMAGAIFCTLWGFPLFALVDSGNPALAVLGIVLAFGGSAAIFGPMLAYFSELFGPELRYTGVGFGYQIGAVLGGGLSPLIANTLVTAAGGSSWLVATYLSAAGLISLLCLLGLPETVRK